MCAILAIQALVFQDGGILALGANVINMAIVGVLAGYLPYHLWGRGRRRRAAIFAGGALSVAGQRPARAGRTVGLRGPHAGLGAGSFARRCSRCRRVIEGAITLAVMGALEAIQPNFVRQPAAGGRSPLRRSGPGRGPAGGGRRLFASTAPDGIQQLAIQTGIAGTRPHSDFDPLQELRGFLAGRRLAAQAGAGLAGLALVWRHLRG